jgi:hypothetical protein
MLNLGKFVHTESGKYIMSVLLGFGLASLFRAACKGRNCVVFNAPPLDSIEDKIYQFDNKCYKYNPLSSRCNSNKKIIQFGYDDQI